MQPLVQAAMESVKQGDKNKAIRFLKQALSINPNDIDAWLALYSAVDNLKYKRHCLNQVITLDPINKFAREELLKMDHMAMNSTFVSGTDTISKPWSGSSTLFKNDNQILDKHPEKPIVFQTSDTITRILTYAFTLSSLCLFLFTLQNDSFFSFPGKTYVFGTLVIVTLPAAWIASWQLKISSKGICVSRLSGLIRREIYWDDIASIQRKPLTKQLKIKSTKGVTLYVFETMRDHSFFSFANYSTFIELLWKKRPDLFTSSPVQGDLFTDIKVFKKSFFRYYGYTFNGILLYLGLVFFVAISKDAHWNFGSITAVFLIAAWAFRLFIDPLFSVRSIKVETDKLTIATFWEEREINAHQIQGIKMITPHIRRRRWVQNFVIISSADGKHFGLSGFAEGMEIIYGVLMNWWTFYRNK